MARQGCGTTAADCEDGSEQGIIGLGTALERWIGAAVPEGATAAEARVHARRSVRELAEMSPDGSREAALACLASELIHRVWVEAPTQPEQARALIDGMAAATGLAPATVGLEVLGDPAPLQLPPALGIGIHLEMLIAISGARHASLWAHDAGGRTVALGRAGSIRTPGGGRQLVQEVLQATPAQAAVCGGTVAVPVLRWQLPHGVVLAHGSPQEAAALQFLLERSARMLALMLERHDLLDSGSRAERAIAGAAERRLARLGLDLHDGPLQSVIAAGQEITRDRDNLSRVLGSGAGEVVVGGWLDDIEERLVELEQELRGYAASLGTAGALAKPLGDALDEVVRQFRERAGIDAALAISGDLQALTQSQQIALLRIVQEGLNNARVHSGARRVRVSVTSTRDHVRAVVEDDGRGFDMERVLVRAARSGRLGLLGMDERVRLLGGTFRVRTREGGPTELTVLLPRWSPDGADATQQKLDERNGQGRPFPV